MTALNAIIESKDNILEDCRLMQAALTDCTGIDTEIESLLEEIDVVTELTKRCIAEAIRAFMFEVQELDALTEFDEKLWLTVIDTVTVHADGRMTFRFQGGTEIET